MIRRERPGLHVLGAALDPRDGVLEILDGLDQLLHAAVVHAREALGGLDGRLHDEPAHLVGARLFEVRLEHLEEHEVRDV